jgi:uncharacterized protein Yka (UPF0111/DUF47 family)
VGVSAGLLVEYMGSGSSEVAKRVIDAEHEGDRLKVRNLTLLNEAFSTPIDREDLHRAIINLDEIINSCKTVVAEMDANVLALKADKYCLEMAVYLKEGAEAVAAGYGRLGSDPKLGRADAEKSDQAVRKLTAPTDAPWPSCSTTPISTTSSAARKSTINCWVRQTV